MDNYIFNKETLKIELHFEKSQYDAIPDALKKELKSAFLWSNAGKCWVSRCKEPNLYGAKRTAEKLGFSGREDKGERLSFADQLERKAERAENRAERYEQYAGNAEKRGENMQKELNSYHGDIAFFTQPIIPGHSGSQRFARMREKIYARYDRGFNEYRKSEYFKVRAETARETAAMDKLKDLGYLDRKVKECRKTIKVYTGYIANSEKMLIRIENGESLKRYDDTPITAESLEITLADYLERVEAEQDKEAYFLNCIDELGGIRFSQENIKVGYIIRVKNYSDPVEVVSTGKVNIQYKSIGFVLQAAYAEIKEIIQERKPAALAHPFKIGETYKAKVWNAEAESKHWSKGAYEEHIFEIIRATDKSITLRDNTTPDASPIVRKPVISPYCGKWNFSISDSYGSTYYKD